MRPGRRPTRAPSAGRSTRSTACRWIPGRSARWRRGRPPRCSGSTCPPAGRWTTRDDGGAAPRARRDGARRRSGPTGIRRSRSRSGVPGEFRAGARFRQRLRGTGRRPRRSRSGRESLVAPAMAEGAPERGRACLPMGVRLDGGTDRPGAGRRPVRGVPGEPPRPRPRRTARRGSPSSGKRGPPSRSTTELRFRRPGRRLRRPSSPRRWRRGWRSPGRGTRASPAGPARRRSCPAGRRKAAPNGRGGGSRPRRSANASSSDCRGERAAPPGNAPS